MNQLVVETSGVLTQMLKKINDTYDQTVDSLRYSFEQSTAQSTATHAQEVEKLHHRIHELEQQLTAVHEKCTMLLSQNEDLRGFKDVSMVKKLSSAVDTLRRENDTLKKSKPSPPIALKPKAPETPTPATAASVAPVAPVASVAVVAASVPVPAAAIADADVDADAEVVDFELFELDCAQYFLDQRGGDLYEVIGNPEDGLVGEQVGQLKNIILRGGNYILNTATQKFYTANNDGTVNDKNGAAGHIENNKAIMRQSKKK